MRRIVAIGLDAAKKLVSALFPRGRVWDRSGDVQALIAAKAPEVARFYSRAAKMVQEEQHGRTAEETIAAWEREYGLPQCGELPETLAERQAAVAAAVRGSGGQSVAYFYGIASALGVNILIEEGPTAPYRSFECGVADINNELGLGRTLAVWRVTAPYETPSAARAALECIFDRLKPAHTLVEYRYATFPDWLSGYLDCNGTVWALAEGAMTGIAGVWTRIVVADDTDGLIYFSGSGGALSYAVTGEGGGFFQAAVPFTGSGVTFTDVDSGVTGLMVVAIGATGTTARFVAVSAAEDYEDTDGGSGAPIGQDDINIAGDGGTRPNGARIYADLVIAGTPTVSELRALLTAPPWEVFDPADILRCYLPALATVDFPDVVIPDVAQQVGGPLSPVNAVMQDGGLDDIEME